MRALRVVGITEGGDVVLEDPERRERFTVPADEQLRAAARGDRTRLGQIAIEVESQLRPREIQARIRAGASVEQVAAAAGVPEQKIERFAYPVLLERSRTAEVAQGAHPVRAEGPDARTLGEVVAHTFGLRGQEYEHAEWDSWKGDDGKWVAALSWRAGRSDNRAHWTFHPGANGGTVTAVDEHASDLVEGLPARPLRTVGPVIDIGRTDEQPSAPAPAEELRATASDTVRGAVDARHEATWHDSARPDPTRPVAERVPVRTTPEQRRPASPAPPQAAPYQSTPYQPAPHQPAPHQPAPHQPAPHQPAPHQAAPPQADQQQPEPDPEDVPATEVPAESPAEPPATEPGADTAPTANRRTKKGKPVMPSWDEVLLGVRGQR